MAGIRVEAEGRTWEFQPDRVVTIGRTPTAGVVITGPSTSRAHAELRPSEDSWTLVDLGTPHGTFVDGVRIVEATVNRALTVRFGREADGTLAQVTPTGPGEPDIVGPTPSNAGQVDPLATRRVGSAGPATAGQRLDAPSTPQRSPSVPALQIGWEGGARTFTRSQVIRLGRDPGLDVVVSHPSVSRLHAEVSVQDGAWVYRDVSSSGSYRDGRPVSTMILTRPAAVRLGDPVHGPELWLSPSLPPAYPSPDGAAPGFHTRRWLVPAVVLAVVVPVAVVSVALARNQGPERPAEDHPATAGTQPTSPSTATTATTTATTPASTPLDVAKTATVLLTATSTTSQGDRVAWQGSGSIIDASGLIMTNAHVAAPEAAGQELLYGHHDVKDPDYLKVSLGSDDDSPAHPAYRARVVVVDGYVDVAILRVYATAEGDALLSPLALPTVPLGDSSQLRTGDEITVLGFPGISDSRGVSVTRGTVSTFVPDERMHSDRAEIDTDARIAPGNSGGIAIDASGDVIGIPFATRADPEVGVLSGRIRPIDFAMPVIEAAEQGTTYESPYLKDVRAGS